MLVDCRGFESALEAVSVSVEAVRVSVEAVRGLKRSLMPRECSRGQENASRGCKKTCRKNCFKKFWNKSKRFGFVPKFLD